MALHLLRGMGRQGRKLWPGATNKLSLCRGRNKMEAATSLESKWMEPLVAWKASNSEVPEHHLVVGNPCS